MIGISSRNAPSLDLPARFMALSMLALALVAIAAPWALPLVPGPVSEFSLLAFVHLITLGFVGSMIIGASYQLVPVALQAPLASVRLGRLSFWFFATGLGTFLAGLVGERLPLLGAGGTLLGIGFLLYIGVILATWARAPQREVVGWHIALALAGAGTGMILGVALAFNKSSGMLGERTFPLLGAHITLMVGGWVMLTFTGVAYRLIGMFTLSERAFRTWLAWAELALIGGGVWLLAARMVIPLPARLGQGAALLLLAGFLAFAIQVAQLYRARIRRAFDVHIPFAVLAALLAIVSAALVLLGLLRELPARDPIWVTAIWLMLIGGAGTAIQGFFYKIATFLVWLKRYAPVAGREPTPRLEALYSLRLAMAGLGLWAVAVIAVAVAVMTETDAALTPLAFVLMGGVACFLANVAGIARHWNRRWQSIGPGRTSPVKAHATATGISRSH